MAKRRLRTLTALLLLAYVGQSLAIMGAPCAPPADVSMSGMDHSGHHMVSDDVTDTCCESGGFCSMSHCLTAAAVPVSPMPAGLPVLQAQPIQDRYTVPANWRESLFRPPISH